jgi:hypothetical protein
MTKLTKRNTPTLRLSKHGWSDNQYNKKRLFVWNYLRTHPCVDCGEGNPIVLEFDHVRGKKRFNISQGKQKCWEDLLAEVEKCDIRCANCHKLKTWFERGYGDFLLERDIKVSPITTRKTQIEDFDFTPPT